MGTFIVTVVVVAVVAMILIPVLAAAFGLVTGHNPNQPDEEHDDWEQEDQENRSETRRR